MKMKNSWHRMNEDEWRQTAIGHNLKVLKWYTTDHSAFCLVRLEWITYMYIYICVYGGKGLINLSKFKHCDITQCINICNANTPEDDIPPTC